MTREATGLRVLIVEDEPMVSEFVQMVLEDSPHRVVGSAETGSEALALAERETPELALVDIKLRGALDGVALAARLRERHPGMLIVFASGSHDPATRARAERIRPDAFLRKPFIGDHLLAVLDGLVAGKVGDVG